QALNSCVRTTARVRLTSERQKKAAMRVAALWPAAARQLKRFRKLRVVPAAHSSPTSSTNRRASAKADRVSDIISLGSFLIASANIEICYKLGTPRMCARHGTD